MKMIECEGGKGQQYGHVLEGYEPGTGRCSACDTPQPVDEDGIVQPHKRPLTKEDAK